MDVQLNTRSNSIVAAAIDVVPSLKAYMIEQSLPLWKSQGWDDRNGGFVERLNEHGNADVEATRRLRVQARQIYSFSFAERKGWLPGAGQLALDGLDYMLARGRNPDGRPGFVHQLNADGSVFDDRRDAYDHAFVLLALASAFCLNKDAQIRAEIGYVLDFLDENLRSLFGGVLESIPLQSPRRQNPHMHLFEAMLALYEATLEDKFLARAGEIFGVFTTCLFDPKTGTLGEFFSPDWIRIAGPTGEIEPGHQAEWVWLLMWYERLSGLSTKPYRNMLLRSALKYVDPLTDCLVDEGDVRGAITKSTRRCWPQTECAKAWIAQTEDRELHAEQQAQAALNRLAKHYLNHPVAGGWYDQFDEEGNSLVDNIPASTMYHIICAVGEADRVLVANRKH